MSNLRKNFFILYLKMPTLESDSWVTYDGTRKKIYMTGDSDAQPYPPGVKKEKK